jgi:hypothetical protein
MAILWRMLNSGKTFWNNSTTDFICDVIYIKTSRVLNLSQITQTSEGHLMNKYIRLRINSRPNFQGHADCVTFMLPYWLRETLPANSCLSMSQPASGGAVNIHRRATVVNTLFYSKGAVITALITKCRAFEKSFNDFLSIRRIFSVLQEWLIFQLDTPIILLLKSYIFCVITACSLSKVNWRFGGTCCLHLHARNVKKPAWSR